jgi:hypothetical protein
MTALLIGYARVYRRPGSDRSTRRAASAWGGSESPLNNLSPTDYENINLTRNEVSA